MFQHLGWWFQCSTQVVTETPFNTWCGELHLPFYNVLQLHWSWLITVSLLERELLTCVISFTRFHSVVPVFSVEFKLAWVHRRKQIFSS